MTNARTPAPFDHAELRAAIAEHSTATSGRARGAHLIARRDGDAFWRLTIRTTGGPIRACTGTGDEARARTIAAAIQADADAGRFAPKAPPADARALALLDAIDRFAASRRRDGRTGSKAGVGEPEARKPGS